MIKATDAIATARKLIGTPYNELDCINLIKRVIRVSPGGDPKFTVAHVPALWASGDDGVANKYHFLTWRQEGLASPRPGLLAFKGKPLGRDHQPSHVGLVTVDAKGAFTVIHSSSVYGRVVETPLTGGEGWTLLAQIRWIAPGGSIQAQSEKEDLVMNEVLYRATVNDLVASDSWLNLRTKASTASKVVARIPAGATVEVLEETNDRWLKVDYEGSVGYCYAKYLTQTALEAYRRLVIVDSEGTAFYPVGDFTVTWQDVTD